MNRLNNKTTMLTYSAVLSAIALIIFVIEAQIPALAPIPGVKLGLANIVTVYAMFVLGPVPAFFIFIVRTTLGGLLTGRVTAMLYSFSGGLMCYIVMLLMRKLLTVRQIWICSVIGAIFHNIGQILAAMLIMGTVSIIVYLPVLMISGIIAGFFTGCCAQFLVKRLG